MVTSLQEGREKVTALQSVYDWAAMRMRLGVHALGRQEDGTRTRQIQARCRLCGLEGRAHMQHLLLECSATAHLRGHGQILEHASSAQGILHWLRHGTSRAQDLAAIERLLCQT
jgi:hypothetical protein